MRGEVRAGRREAAGDGGARSVQGSTCAARRMDPELEATIVSHIGSVPRSAIKTSRPIE